jgi:hypothetical protein
LNYNGNVNLAIKIATEKYSENAQMSTAETGKTRFRRFCHYATGEFP